jgi:hypothetical protein
MSFDAVLLVEGQDDKHVVSNLLFAHGLDSAFEVKDKDGLPNLLLTLPTELRASDLKCLGVIVDADSPIASRWERIRAVLIRAGYPFVPIEPQGEGTILTAPGKPRVGVWMMPNNRLDGMLEDFAGLLVPADDTLLPRAHAAVGQIPAAERRFAQAHEMKAVIHTWLAWQQEPGVRMGAAVTRKFLHSHSPVATVFVRWLQRLQIF